MKVRKENKAKSGHKNRANEKHASGVWDTYSPTGIFLGEQFCFFEPGSLNLLLLEFVPLLRLLL